MNIPPTIAAEQATNKQNVALSVIKQAAEQQQKIVEIITESAVNQPVSGARGSNVNISI